MRPTQFDFKTNHHPARELRAGDGIAWPTPCHAGRVGVILRFVGKFAVCRSGRSIRLILTKSLNRPSAIVHRHRVTQAYHQDDHAAGVNVYA